MIASNRSNYEPDYRHDWNDYFLQNRDINCKKKVEEVKEASSAFNPWLDDWNDGVYFLINKEND